MGNNQFHCCGEHKFLERIKYWNLDNCQSQNIYHFKVIKDLFLWKWGTPGRWGNPLHYNLSTPEFPATPPKQVTPSWDVYMANCLPGWQSYVTQKTEQLSMADYHTYRVNVYEQAKILDRWVTPPRHAQVTSPTWDPLPPPEQALKVWCYWYK